MKGFLTVLMAVVACLCLIQGADAWNNPKPDDRFRCFERNRDVGQVISDFCFGNKGMVGSIYIALDTIPAAHHILT